MDVAVTTGAALQDEHMAREAKREKSFVVKHNKLRHRIRELELEIGILTDLIISCRFVSSETQRLGLPEYRPGLTIAVGLRQTRIETAQAEIAKTSETLAELVGGQ